jgi:VanZ family protein
MSRSSLHDTSSRPWYSPLFLAGLMLRHSGKFCIAICIGYVFAGFMPFDFAPRNRVSWPADHHGIQFEPLSQVYSENSLELNGSAGASGQAGSITIELWLKSMAIANENTHTILSLYDGTMPANLIVAQWQSALLIRTPLRDAAAPQRYREAGIDNALPVGKPRFIAITSGSKGTFFYLDGSLADSHLRLHLRADTLRGRLILGNSPDGSTPWRGTIMGLAMYKAQLGAADIQRHFQMWGAQHGKEIASDAALAALYLFDEGAAGTIQDHSGMHNTLAVPRRFFTLRKTILLSPWDDFPTSLHDIKDIVINILGFAPFGFFYFAYLNGKRPDRRLRNLIWTLLLSGAMSTTIEFIQAFLPTRTSSCLDIISNVTGALGGVILTAALLWAISPEPTADSKFEIRDSRLEY